MKPSTDRRKAVFGPVIVAIVALGLSGLVVSSYADFYVQQADKTSVVHYAKKLTSESQGRGEIISAIRRAGYDVRSVQASPRSAAYSFLRNLAYLDLETGQTRLGESVAKSDANLWMTARNGQTLNDGIGSVRGLGFAPGDVAYIVEAPRRGAELGSFYMALFCTVLLGLLAWILCLRRFPNSTWPTLVGPAVASLSMCLCMVLTLLQLDGQIPAITVTQQMNWGASQYGVFALPLLPFLWGAIHGWMNAGDPSPNRVAYSYIAPAVIGLGALVLLPFIFGVGLSFFRFSKGDFSWVGLAHFVEILTNQDYGIAHPLNFYFTLGVTILWTALNVFLHVSIGLAVALVLNRSDLRFKGVYRVLLIVPWAVPSYITALVWKGMFNHQFGVINAALNRMGLDSVDWFGAFSTSFGANVATNTWLGFPFMMVVALGALQSIPKDLYEAAEVDGANRWQAFRQITVPLLRPALLPAVIMGSVWTFNMFNIVYLVSGGRPDGSTDILITEAYRWAFERERYGYAAAYSLVIFFVLLGYSALTQRAGRNDEVTA